MSPELRNKKLTFDNIQEKVSRIRGEKETGVFHVRLICNKAHIEHWERIKIKTKNKIIKVLFNVALTTNNKH